MWENLVYCVWVTYLLGDVQPDLGLFQIGHYNTHIFEMDKTSKYFKYQ